MFRALLLTLSLPLALVACGERATDSEAASSADQSEAAGETTALTVYKSPTCGCCEDWIDHMDEAGFESSIEHPERMATIKQQLGITREYGSCHTGVSEDGYVFEGHVPAKLVRRFLDEPPEDARGLAVPQMPVGSPGMEMGERFEPYEVLLLKRDGGSEVYARIESPEQQY